MNRLRGGRLISLPGNGSKVFLGSRDILLGQGIEHLPDGCLDFGLNRPIPIAADDTLTKSFFSTCRMGHGNQFLL
jgi:hypothetical protein